MQHRVVLRVGEKVRFVGGRGFSTIWRLQRETAAFVHLDYGGGALSVFGGKVAVQHALKWLKGYLAKMVFVELECRISWVCGPRHEWIERMRTQYECELYTEPTGRLVVIAAPPVLNAVMRSVNERLSRCPPERELLTKVGRYAVSGRVAAAESIAELIRVVRNHRHEVGLESLFAIFHRLARLREQEMEQEAAMLSAGTTAFEQRLDDALSVRRRKNSDFMHFMGRFAAKHLPEIVCIRTAAEMVWCFAIFGVRRFGDDRRSRSGPEQSECALWRAAVDRLLALYGDGDVHRDRSGNAINSRDRRLHSLGKCLGAFSVAHPVGYGQYGEDLAFLLSTLHRDMSHLGGSTISYALKAVTQNGAAFMALTRNCSFLADRKVNIWRFLSERRHFRAMRNGMAHLNVEMVLHSLCTLQPLFHRNYPDIADSDEMAAAVHNLCAELFFYADSLELRRSVPIIGHLVELGFYSEHLLDFLLPEDRWRRVDVDDAAIWSKANIHRLIYSLAKSRHLAQPHILKATARRLMEHRSSFELSHFVDAVWSVMAMHFLASTSPPDAHSDADADGVVLSRSMMAAMLKTLSGRLSDCDLSVLPNSMAVKLLQIQRISKLLHSANPPMLPQFERMLRDGLRSELRVQQQFGGDDDEDGGGGTKKWDRNVFNAQILQSINRVLYGEEVQSDSFLMKTKHEIAGRASQRDRGGAMEFDYVTPDGLVVDLCVDEKGKRGIVALGPGDVFIDDEDRMCGENYVNWLLLTAYSEWDILCLHWKTHSTEQAITDAVKQWIEKEPGQKLIGGRKRRKYLY